MFNKREIVYKEFEKILKLVASWTCAGNDLQSGLS